MISRDLTSARQSRVRVRRAAFVAMLGLACSACDQAVTATDGRIGSIGVTPPSLALSTGAARALTATVVDESGSTIAGAQVHWASEDPNVATVTPQGIVTALVAGKTQIAASKGGKSVMVAVSVSALPPALVRVNPTSSSVFVGATTRLTAEVRDAGGGILTGHTLTWTSATASIATVNANGVVTGRSAGNVVITAAAAGLNGTAVVTVRAVPVSTVTVTPAAGIVAVGATLALVVSLRDAVGAILTGRPISWSSSDTRIATVTNAGLVRAVAKGTVTITATSEGKAGTSAIDVR